MKRGQAAMEFLMTYGWALLVVLVAIGALAFFGVLNPGQFLPDQCVFFAGLTCQNAYADADDNNAAVGGNSVIVFDAQNGLGYTMTGFDIPLLQVSISGTGGALSVTGTPIQCDGTANLVDGTTTKCTINFGPPTPGGFNVGEKVKGTISLSWDDAAGQSHTRTGTLSLTAEG
mgnify:CR=1 FL=1